MTDTSAPAARPASPLGAPPGPLGLVVPTFPQDGPGVSVRLPEWCAGAEADGIEGLWVCDHLFWHGPCLECLTTLAVVAASTRRTRLGSAVLQLPLRTPAAVAKAAATIQVLSGGRLVLGVGAGLHEWEYEAADADFGGRGAALDRGIDRLRALWAGLGAGDHPPQAPQPDPIPIWVGGPSAVARRRAAARGDGWVPMFLDPAGARDAFAALASDLDRAGRRVEDVTRALLVFVSVDRDPVRARERGRHWLSRLYRVPEHAVERHLLAGSAEEIAARLVTYREAGVQHFVVFATDDEPRRSFGELRRATTAAGLEEGS